MILASNSPRRRELLKGLDLAFEVKVIQGVGESYPESLPVDKVPEFISREKASVYHVAGDELLLTADTVVILDGDILGKPRDADEARSMLRRLSRHTHQVVTGVCLTTSESQKSFSETTAVTFRNLSDAEIAYYVEHYKPFDKAGAYGVQEWIGYIGVTRLEGSFYNVMGLPVERVYEALKEQL